MALNPFYLFIFASLFANFSSCLTPKLLNVSIDSARSFSPAGATWYGSPTGAGSTGGACGYANDVTLPPFSGMISAGNPNLFKSGKGCGTCYQIKCTKNAACSGKPVTVTITDECPGCTSERIHFDLSGIAFGAMAKHGRANTLRNAGRLNVDFRRVPCNYPGTKLAFHVDQGATRDYFACVIEYEDGDGDVAWAELRVGKKWIPMQQSWGALWKTNLSPGTRGPFSIKLTTVESKKWLVAKNVIPANWAPGKTYRSLVNF